MVDYHLIHLVFLISSLFHRFLNVKYDLSLPALVCLDMLEVMKGNGFHVGTSATRRNKFRAIDSPT
jgi:hypothetical protein